MLVPSENDGWNDGPKLVPVRSIVEVPEKSLLLRGVDAARNRPGRTGAIVVTVLAVGALGIAVASGGEEGDGSPSRTDTSTASTGNGLSTVTAAPEAIVVSPQTSVAATESTASPRVIVIGGPESTAPSPAIVVGATPSTLLEAAPTTLAPLMEAPTITAAAPVVETTVVAPTTLPPETTAVAPVAPPLLLGGGEFACDSTTVHTIAAGDFMINVVQTYSPTIAAEAGAVVMRLTELTIAELNGGNNGGLVGTDMTIGTGCRPGST